MTVSWGSMGELWGKDSVTVYIRPQRYTEEFMNSNDHFTLSFYPLDKKQAIHGICGSKSGRDVDKVKECNLTPNFDENAPYFEEAQLVLVCKKWQKASSTQKISQMLQLTADGILKRLSLYLFCRDRKSLDF